MEDHAMQASLTVTRKPMLKCVTLLAAASLAFTPLAGCETIERETGINMPTQQGAVGGAAFGGIVAAIAGANPAWIAASVVLGGVTGGAIGNYLGKKDAERHARNNSNALDGLGQGQTSSWRNERSGNYGSTTVTKVSREGDGRVCKSYRETVHTRVESVTKEATACRNPGGTWRLA
jgi:surface antigen